MKYPPQMCFTDMAHRMMTCTPYMINSQRLLITGRRVPYHAADAEASKWAELWNKLKFYVWLVAIAALLLLMGRLLRGLIIGRTRYLLVVPSGASQAVVRRGRHQRTFTPDDEGRIEHKLPGGRYWVTVETAAGTVRYRASIKHQKDRQLTLKRK